MANRVRTKRLSARRRRRRKLRKLRLHYAGASSGAVRQQILDKARRICPMLTKEEFLAPIKRVGGRIDE